MFNKYNSNKHILNTYINNNTYSYSLLFNDNLYKHIKMFQHKSDGYNTEHTPEEHLRILWEHCSNKRVGILIKEHDNPVILLISINAYIEDIHARGKVFHGEFLGSLYPSFMGIRYLHKVLNILCSSFDLNYYTIPSRVKKHEYKIKYYKVKEVSK